MNVNTQDAAQFGLINFSKFTLKDMGSGSQIYLNGKYFEQQEGTGLYVEAADYPYLLSFHNTRGSIENSFALREGQQYDSPFKGFTITAPLIQSAAGLSLIICKNGASHINQLAQPVVRLGTTSRTVSITAATQIVMGIFVPPGVRSLNNLSAVIGATTMTNVVATFLDVNGNQIVAPFQAQNVGAVNQSYTVTGAPYANIQNPTSGFPVALFNALPIPTQCVEIQLQINGTGLVGTPNIYGTWE